MNKLLISTTLALTLTACAAKGPNGPNVTAYDTVQQIASGICNLAIPIQFIQAAYLEAGAGAAVTTVAKIACSIAQQPDPYKRPSVRQVMRRA